MTSPTITLDHLIQTRLTEIAEDAWHDHRVVPVKSGDGRVLGLGTSAVWEQWHCQADQGYGVCGEPLLTHQQASTLLGMYNDDEPVPDPHPAGGDRTARPVQGLLHAGGAVPLLRRRRRVQEGLTMPNNPPAYGHLCYVLATGIVVGWIALLVRDLRRDLRRGR